MGKKLIRIINFVFLQWFGLRLKIKYIQTKWEKIDISLDGGPWEEGCWRSIRKKITLLKGIRPLSGWWSGLRRWCDDL